MLSVLVFITFVFDPRRVARGYPGRDRDRLLVASLTATTYRHACWGGLTEVQKSAGGSALRKLADRPDLLAEVAGLGAGRR